MLGPVVRGGTHFIRIVEPRDSTEHKGDFCVSHQQRQTVRGSLVRRLRNEQEPRKGHIPNVLTTSLAAKNLLQHYLWRFAAAQALLSLPEDRMDPNTLRWSRLPAKENTTQIFWRFKARHRTIGARRIALSGRRRDCSIQPRRSHRPVPGYVRRRSKWLTGKIERDLDERRFRANRENKVRQGTAATRATTGAGRTLEKPRHRPKTGQFARP